MRLSRIFLFSVLILLTGLLSACAGGSGVANSWPGVSASEDTAFVANNNHVYAVSLASGAQTWRFPAETDNKVSFYAAPVLTEDGQLLAGGYNKVLYSLDPANGTQKWAFSGAKDRYIASPLVTPAGIFAPNSDTYLYALDLSGKLRWSFKTEHALWSTPVADGDVIYLAAMDHHVYALNAQSGELIWKSDDLGGALVGNPSLGPDGALTMGTFGSEMLSLNTEDGRVRWETPTNAWVWSGPTVDDEQLYFGDLSGILYALNAASGEIIWQAQPDTSAEQAISDKPLALDGTLYFSSESGNLHAVAAENGNPRWSKTIGGKLYSSPLAVGDSLLVAPVGADALLVALDTNGNQKWTFTPEK